MANDINTVGEYNIKTPRGATFQRQLTWKSNDTPIDITGYSARFTVKKRQKDAQVVVALNEASGITLGGVAGTILVEIDATTMQSLDVLEYVYDLEMESASGFITRLVEGTFEVTRGVTS